MRRLLLALLCCSCGGGDTTAVDVAIDVDGCLVDLVARLEVIVLDGNGAEVARFDEGSPTFPTGVRIVEGDTSDWTVEANIYPRASARPIARARAFGSFSDGELTQRGLLFEDACVGVLCANESATCVAGECIDRAAIAPELSVTPAPADSCANTVFVRTAPACGGPDDRTCGDTRVTHVELAAVGCTLDAVERLTTSVFNGARESVGEFDDAVTDNPLASVRIVGDAMSTWSIDARLFDTSAETSVDRPLSRLRAFGDFAREERAVLFEDECLGIVCSGDRVCVDGACADADPVAPETVNARAANACRDTILAPPCSDVASCPETRAVELIIDADACVVANADAGTVSVPSDVAPRSFDIAELPLTLRLVGDDGSWNVDVDLLKREQPIARARAVGDFAESTRALVLRNDCLGVVCGADQTCQVGDCIDTASAEKLTSATPDTTGDCPNVAFAARCNDAVTCETTGSQVTIQADPCLAGLAVRREVSLLGEDGALLYGPIIDTEPAEPFSLRVASDDTSWSLRTTLHGERSERPIAESIAPRESSETVRIQDACLGVLCSRGASCVDGLCIDAADLGSTSPAIEPASLRACPGVFFATAAARNNDPLDCGQRNLSIEDARDCVNQNGGLVEIASGSYGVIDIGGGSLNRDVRGDVILDQPIVRMAHATFRGMSPDPDERPVFDGRAARDFRTFRVGRAYLTIDSIRARGGLRVMTVNAGCTAVDRNADGVVDDCISYLDQIEIRGCEAEELLSSAVDPDGDPYSDRAGLVVNNSVTNILIEDCVFRGNDALNTDGGGVYFNSSQNIRFRHNRLYNNGPRGLAVLGSETTAEITDNRFCTNDIELSNGEVAFRRNTVVGAPAVGAPDDEIYASGDAMRVVRATVLLEQNIFAQNTRAPVVVEGGSVSDRRNLYFENGVNDSSFSPDMPDTDLTSDPIFVTELSEDADCTLLLSDDSPARNDDPTLAIGAY